MRDFNFDIQPLALYPVDEFCYLPEQLLIKELSITPDYENILLLVQTISKRPPSSPMVTNHVNIDQTEITIPLSNYKALFNEDGTINNDAANYFLQSFYVMIKPAADITISQDNILVTDETNVQ